MKFEINSNAFYSAVNAAAKLAIKNKEYTGIEIKTLDGKVQVTGYMQEKNITGNYLAEAKVIEEGSVVVPGKFTANIAKELPAGTIKVADTEDAVVLSFGTGKTMRVKKMLNEQNISIPLLKAGKTICTVQFEDISNLITKALGALHEPRAHFDSVFFNITEQEGENVIEAVSTDTKVLHRQLPMGKAEGTGKFIVPSAFMTECMELLRICTDKPSLVFTEDNKVVFQCSKGQIISNLFGAQYPDWRVLCPQEGPAAEDYKKTIKAQVMVQSPEVLKEILGRALTCSDAKSTSTLLVAKPDIMKVVHISDHGQLVDELPVAFKGEPVSLVVNIKQLYNTVKQMTGTMIMAITGDTKPVIAQEFVRDEAGKLAPSGFIGINTPVSEPKYSSIREQILNEQPTLNFNQKPAPVEKPVEVGIETVQAENQPAPAAQQTSQEPAAQPAGEPAEAPQELQTKAS